MLYNRPAARRRYIAPTHEARRSLSLGPSSSEHAAASSAATHVPSHEDQVRKPSRQPRVRRAAHCPTAVASLPLALPLVGGRRSVVNDAAAHPPAPRGALLLGERGVSQP